MSVRKFMIEVTQMIEVTLDESKFDETFMAEFRESFFPFDTLEEHAKHIGQLQARGIIDASYGDHFIEGYGPASEMGIKADEDAVYTEVTP